MTQAKQMCCGAILTPLMQAFIFFFTVNNLIFQRFNCSIARLQGMWWRLAAYINVLTTRMLPKLCTIITSKPDISTNWLTLLPSSSYRSKHSALQQPSGNKNIIFQTPASDSHMTWSLWQHQISAQHGTGKNEGRRTRLDGHSIFNIMTWKILTGIICTWTCITTRTRNYTCITRTCIRITTCTGTGVVFWGRLEKFRNMKKLVPSLATGNIHSNPFWWTVVWLRAMTPGDSQFQQTWGYLFVII